LIYTEPTKDSELQGDKKTTAKNAYLSKGLALELADFPFNLAKSKAISIVTGAINAQPSGVPNQVIGITFLLARRD